MSACVQAPVFCLSVAGVNVYVVKSAGYLSFSTSSRLSIESHTQTPTKTGKQDDKASTVQVQLSSRRGLLGKLMVSSCMLVGVCRHRFLMRTPYRTLDRRRFRMRMVGLLLAVSASCVFPLRFILLASNSQLAFLTDERQRLGLRPPAAMTVG